jgi:hypothetical protein
MNPGGSVKDRPALHLILDAERRGYMYVGCLDVYTLYVYIFDVY